MRQERFRKDERGVQFGVTGLLRAIVLTAMVTSAGWVLLGVWWLDIHPPRQSAGPVPVSAGPSPTAGGSGKVLVPMVSPVGMPDRGDGGVPAGALRIPVSGTRASELVDTFSQARAAGARRHDAIDIMAPRGTPVLAATDGMVEKLFLSRDGGNTVYQRSPDGRMILYYAHLDGYAPDLREGQVLRRGEPLGFVGNTGNANPAAPHLHFAVMLTSPQARWFEAATPVNPYPLLAGPARSDRQAAVSGPAP